MENSLDVQIVPINQVHDCGFNPASRYAKNRIAEISESISRLGVMQPILVVPRRGGGFTTADGHRRVYGARECGFTEVPVRIFYNTTVEDVYRDANHTPQKTTGNQTLQVFVENPRAVSIRIYHKLYKMSVAIGGGYFTRKLAKMGGSCHTYNLATRVLNYCGQESDVQNYQVVLTYMLTEKCTDRVRSAMQLAMLPAKLWQMIIDNIKL